MGGKYDHLDRHTLIRLLERRDAERQLGLVWERDEEKIEQDHAVNSDYVALDLDPSLSHGASPWGNLIIEGDNYDALRALRATHKGCIRCIYIDPPYNTGNRDFVYNDRFIEKTHTFRHSLWLEFMYRRLRLAKDLLADDGVIFVSIDDNEVFRLGMLMDQVFGEGNFIANVIWQKRTSPDSRIDLGPAHDYILVYAKKREKSSLRKLTISADQARKFKNPDNDPRGPWASTDFTAQGYRPNQMYTITTPSGQTISPPTGRCWSNIEPVYNTLLADNRIWFGEGGSNRPRIKTFLYESEGISSWSWWPHQEVGSNQEAKREIIDILDPSDTNSIFSTPKPVRLIERILKIASKPDDIVADFFAGSGTTAHAVAKLNAEDGGNRRFILVSNAEATKDEPDKNLCRDVCAERVRRVMAGYRSAKGEDIDGLGGGFAYLRTRRVPQHRLNQKLAHAEIWHALELAHGLGITPWPGAGHAVRREDNRAIAYLADFRTGTVAGLIAELGTKPAAALILYSWSPDRAREFLPNAQHQPIPQFLRDRFGNEARQ